MQLVHDQMFRSAVLRHRGEPGWEQFEAGAFARLREMIVHEARLSPACPRRNVMEDQIVWARSPCDSTSRAAGRIRPPTASSTAARW